jgi:hypothetical protein
LLQIQRLEILEENMMSAKERHVRGIFIGAIILLVLACNVPAGKIPKTPTQVTHIITATRPLSAQNVISSKTPTPTSFDLGSIVNFGAGGTQEPMITLTPKLPDFDPVINFGGGGSEVECREFDAPNKISIPNVAFGHSTQFCMSILGMDFNKPFHLRLTAPNGREYISPSLRLNQSKKTIQWEGYRGFAGNAEWSGNGILYVDISILWPGSFSEGQWQIKAYGDNFFADGNFSFTKQAREPYLISIDSRYEAQIVPGTTVTGLHPVKPKGNGKIDLIGGGFPSNTEIYILLYRSSNFAKAELIQTLFVISDSAGSVKAELSGPFEKGEPYLVIGLSDPNTPLSGGVLNSDPNFPSDLFLIESESATVESGQTSSCPGAPSQRMVVNQSGYVCTKEDAVKLRSAPRRSGSEILQLVPGTSFTVIGGPSCADNWSWWNVRLDNGTTGWVSEGGDQIDPYFICP